MTELYARIELFSPFRSIHRKDEGVEIDAIENIFNLALPQIFGEGKKFEAIKRVYNNKTRKNIFVGFLKKKAFVEDGGTLECPIFSFSEEVSNVYAN